MNAEDRPVLARIREARMRISEEFNHNPELIAKHYMQFQKRTWGSVGTIDGPADDDTT